MNEQDVRDLLDDLANTPAPPSRVDVPRAVTTVRRGRVRALTAAAASVLVVGLAVGYVVSSPSASPGVVSPAAPVTSAPSRFDPLVEYASFGWLPEQLNSRLTSTTGEQITLNASKFVPDPANGPGTALPAENVDVRLYAAGVVPLTDKPIEVGVGDSTQTQHYGPVTEAPAVNGVPAYWVGSPGGGIEILKWRYAPNAWAELGISEFGSDHREIAHRIASELRVGGTGRLRFPFQLTGVPASVRPVSSEVGEGGFDGPWHASLDLNAGTDGPGVSVNLHPTNESDNREPNTTVEGHPARRETFAGDHLGRPEYSDRLYFNDLDGVNATILISATSAEAAAPLGGVLAVYRALTVLPDRANWTDQPVSFS